MGLVGEPFSIETTSQFEKATITYVIDKSKLGETEFDNLLFLWYDEENDVFVELDTILDSVGLIPVIGVIKNIDKMKNADEFIDVVKNLEKFSGSVDLTGKDIYSDIFSIKL